MSIFNSTYTAERLEGMLKKRDVKIHFGGVLGAGMLPLASIFAALGYNVRGSDRSVVEPDFSRDGIAVYPPSRENIADADIFVYTLALSALDEEYLAARARRIPAVSRAQLLGALMREYGERIAVSGSHGKSTVTALIDCVLNSSAVPLTTVPGARLYDGQAYRLSRQGTQSGGDLSDREASSVAGKAAHGITGGDILLAEACEYKDSFLSLYPTIGVITSVELDHTDYFSSLADISASFRTFARRAKRALVINIDYPDGEAIAKELSSTTEIVTYGKSHAADLSYEKITTSGTPCRFFVYFKGERLMECSTMLLGDYNMENILAAIAVCRLVGIQTEEICSAISRFSGIDRRLSLISALNGRRVYYDYAHHPREISLSIEAVREVDGECTVVFSPHTYSRTKSLWDGFIASLSKADFTIITDIYPAREDPIEGITSERLAKSMNNGAVYLSDRDVLSYVRNSTRGSIILMGAGDNEYIKNEFLRNEDG